VRVLNAKGGTYIAVSLLQDFVLDALLSYFNKGIGNKYFSENIIDFRIQRLDKRAKKGEDRGLFNFLPFFITIKRTTINPEDEKMQELRKKLSEIVSYIDSPLSKAELLSVSQI
jgi:hypothetical protein